MSQLKKIQKNSRDFLYVLEDSKLIWAKNIFSISKIFYVPAQLKIAVAPHTPPLPLAVMCGLTNG